MIDKNNKLIDLQRLAQFKQLCDGAYMPQELYVDGLFIASRGEQSYNDKDIQDIINITKKLI